jgi:phage terminase large subunit
VSFELCPTLPQDRFIFSTAAYPAFVGGFGSGKTDALITRGLKLKLEFPANDVAFYEPTYDLVRMIAFPRFQEKLEQIGLPYRLIKSPHNVIEIPGAGRIIFRSMDTPSRIIGYEVGDSLVDELDTLKRDDAALVWRQIIARNRQKKAGGAINSASVATTPEGFRFVYERWEANPVDGCELIRAPTYSNPHLPPGYIDSLRSMYPSHLLDAYVEGQFVNLTTGTVYLQFNRKRNNSNETIKPNEPLYIGMDFNVGNMSAVVHVKRAGEPHAVDEIAKGYDTPDMARMITERYQGHSIIVYPDASGASRKSVNASKTDIQILQDHKFTVVAPKANPPVRDRINAMNAAFSGGYRVNTDRCPIYTRCLEQQAYNNNGEPDKSQGLDHMPDAGGYFIAQDYPIIRPVTSLSLKTIF